MKIRYSRKVRALGLGIIAFQILAVFLWAAAIYGNGATAFSIISSSFISASGKSIIENSSSGQVISVQVTGSGILPVSTTVSVDAVYLNSQNQTVAHVSDSVTVSPGETRNITLTVPKGLVSSSGTLTGYHVKATFEISTLGGLVGTKIEATVNPLSGDTSA